MSDKTDSIVSGTFTARDLANLITQMAESNRDAYKDFAKELALSMKNPPLTAAEQEKAEQRRASRAQEAREFDANKEYRRKHCVSPASPHAPHRRTGASWGLFNGTSVIAWTYSTFSYREPVTGRSLERGPFPQGVCMWCASEFKPGDADYEEALSWGVNAIGGTFNMDIHTGNWV